jgi:hypothetical protein
MIGQTIYEKFTSGFIRYKPKYLFHNNVSISAFKKLNGLCIIRNKSILSTYLAISAAPIHNLVHF